MSFFPFDPAAGGGGGIGFTSLNDFIIISVDTSSPPTPVVILSSLIAVDYNLFIIKDESGNAATNNAPISTEGGELFDGSATIPSITANYGGIMAYSHNGNLFNWGT